jgi:transposase
LRDQEADGLQKRQVYDLPPMKLVVTEHQAEVKRCRCGHLNRADFPAEVGSHVQYGPGLKSLLVYLQDYQLLPYERTRELVSDLWGHSISTGTLYNIRRFAFDQLASFEQRLMMALTLVVLAGFDETGLRVMAKNYWLHSCSTERYVHYTVHAKRGKEAMKAGGILPSFRGIAMHDFYSSYFQFDCQHALCNAHLLRELEFIIDHYGQEWAEEMAAWLVKMQQAKERAMAQGKTALSAATVGWYRRRYRILVQKGLQENPLEPPPEGKKKRGRKKKSKPRNLLERLQKYETEILRFLDDFRVPFDNNASERDLRMMKVKMKVSGGFRSLEGAQMFARTRSYVMTARKQGINMLEALRDVFMSNTLGSQLTAVAGC